MASKPLGMLDGPFGPDGISLRQAQHQLDEYYNRRLQNIVKPLPMKIVFLCGPYTAPSRRAIGSNIRQAEAVARSIARVGLGFLCPHTNSRHMHDLPNEPHYWYTMYLHLLESCDALFAFGNYQRSVGCQAEIAHANRLEIPTFDDFDELCTWAGVRHEK